MIKAILFDMGGVVCEEMREKRYLSLSKLSRSKLDYRIINERIKPYTDRFDSGKISPVSFWRLVANSLEIKDYNKVKKVWINTVGKNKKEIIQLAKRLKENGYKIGILSNTNKLAANTHKKRGDYKSFSPLILSYETGYVKPQKEIYRIALKRLKVRPEDCILIDDQEDKLLPAKKLGIKTILFKSAIELSKELNKLL